MDPYPLCSISLPFNQYVLYFTPTSKDLANGHVGHIHPFGSVMQFTLFPVTQKSFSLASSAHLFHVGQ